MGGGSRDRRASLLFPLSVRVAWTGSDALVVVVVLFLLVLVLLVHDPEVLAPSSPSSGGGRVLPW